MHNKAQMNLSFGMIFSIILIIVFVVFAFYGIKTFLEMKDTAKIVKFREDLQNDVDGIWKGDGTRDTFKYYLPPKIKGICFKKWNYENLIFETGEDFSDLTPVNITHIDIVKTTEDENPLCFNVEKGEVNIILKKGFGEESVTVSR